MSKIAAIIGRLFLGLLFVLSGAGKLMDLSGTNAAIEAVGLPGGLAVITAVFELVAGLLLMAGFMVRLVSILLFGFVALTILFFHNQITDPIEGQMALKNLAIMGGLLLAFAHSQMWSHYYSIKKTRKGELATQDAERRAHEAELRAARAEGRAEGGATTKIDTDGDGYADTTTRTTSRRHRWFDW